MVLASERNVQSYVDEYAALTTQLEATKTRLSELKAFFEQDAVEQLKDTKLQSCHYWGSHNTKVTVTLSNTGKPLSLKMIAQLLGPLAKDFIRVKETEELTDSGKRLLNSIALGNYLRNASLESLVSSIVSDAKMETTLLKKLKGKFSQDKKTFMAVAGLDEGHASSMAYLAEEIVNWQRFSQVLAAAGWNGSEEEAIRIVNAAVIVEEGIKVGLQMEP